MARLHFQREPAEVEIDLGGGERFFVTLRPLSYGERERLLHRLRSVCLRVEREFDDEMKPLLGGDAAYETALREVDRGGQAMEDDGRARAFATKLVLAREHGLDLGAVLNAALEPVYRDLCRAAVTAHRELRYADESAIEFSASETTGASDATLGVYASAEVNGMTLTAHIAQAVLKMNRLDDAAKKK